MLVSQQESLLAGGGKGYPYPAEVAQVEERPLRRRCVVESEECGAANPPQDHSDAGSPHPK